MDAQACRARLYCPHLPNTLAPNIKVEFSGPITKEVDTDNIMSHVSEQLKEMIATAPEGVPT